MNPVDIFVLVLVLLSALVGLMRGLIREVLSIASWVAAALIAWWLLPRATPIAANLLQGISPQPVVHQIAAGATVFIVLLIVFAIVSHLIASLVEGSVLGAIDRSLGFIFGIARGVILAGLAYLGIFWAAPPPAQGQPVTPPWTWIREARSLNLLEQTAEFLRNLAPPEFRMAPPPVQGRATPTFQDAIRGLATPTPNTPARSGESGYAPSDRQQVDRLIQGSNR